MSTLQAPDVRGRIEDDEAALRLMASTAPGRSVEIRVHGSVDHGDAAGLEGLVFDQRRDPRAAAVGAEAPAVIAALEHATVAPPLGKPRGAVTAAVLERCGLPLFIEEQNDRLAQQREWNRPAFAQLAHRHHRMPEPSEYALSGGQHD